MPDAQNPIADGHRLTPKTASAAAPAARRDIIIGIGMLCLAVFLFSLQDVIIKALSGAYPVGQVLAVRSTVALPLFLLMVHFTSGLPSLGRGPFGPVVLRAVLLLLAYLCYYLAIAALPLADATALYFVTPLLVVALAGWLLREPIGIVRWLAVGIGFAGAIIALNPGSAVFDWAALLALASAFTYGLAQVMARGMRDTHSAAVLSFYQNMVLLTAALLFGAIATQALPRFEHPSLAFLTRPFVWPQQQDLLLMAACGPIAAIASVLLTEAYRRAPANTVTVFEYTSLLWLAMWGFLIWSEVPQPATLLGAGLIVVAGLVALFAPAGRR